MAKRQGLIGRNPLSLIASPKATQKEMKALNDTQVHQLLIAAQGNRYEFLYHLAVTTGLRQGELIGLKWEEFDWATNSLQVKRLLHHRKAEGLVFSSLNTKAGRRTDQLGSASRRLLAEHRKRQGVERQKPGWQEHERVFSSMVGPPSDQRRLHKYFNRLLKKGVLPDILFHDLRHTAATLILMNDIPMIIQSQVGSLLAKCDFRHLRTLFTRDAGESCKPNG
jgi:integrase